MKKREINFIVSAIAGFFVTWSVLRGLMEAAQGVGDAPANFNPTMKALPYGLIAVCIYGFIYYIIALFIGKKDN